MVRLSSYSLWDWWISNPLEEITLSDIYRSIIPFVLVMVFGLSLVMIFPEIATYLPDKYLSNN